MIIETVHTYVTSWMNMWIYYTNLLCECKSWLKLAYKKTRIIGNDKTVFETL